MFCLYGAVLSAITPPVALAAYAASGIAKANPIKIGFTACKFGIVAFIVPFFFAYQPALLWIGTLPEVITAMGIQGQSRRPMSWPSRILAIAGAVLLIYPGTMTDIIGLVLIVISMIPQLKKKDVQ